MDEGYIKFRAHWQQGPAYPQDALAPLLKWRAHYYRLGLIGAYNERIGYGNISQRFGDSTAFYVSGSATGLLPSIDERHFAKVNKVRVHTNELWCEGPVIASSESMSHAAIYADLPQVGAILHAHHRLLWDQMLHQVPTTPADAPYGSPAMVAGIQTLIRETNVAEVHTFAMAGHEEGLFFFGKNFTELEEVVHGMLNRFEVRL